MPVLRLSPAMVALALFSTVALHIEHCAEAVKETVSDIKPMIIAIICFIIKMRNKDVSSNR